SAHQIQKHGQMLPHQLQHNYDQCLVLPRPNMRLAEEGHASTSDTDSHEFLLVDKSTRSCVRESLLPFLNFCIQLMFFDNIIYKAPVVGFIGADDIAKIQQFSCST